MTPDALLYRREFSFDNATHAVNRITAKLRCQMAILRRVQNQRPLVPRLLAFVETRANLSRRPLTFFRAREP